MTGEIPTVAGIRAVIAEFKTRYEAYGTTMYDMFGHDEEYSRALDNLFKLLVPNESERAQALEILKPFCVELEHIEDGTFQGGEEECFLAGAKTKGTCYAYSPDWKPFKSEDDE